MSFAKALEALKAHPVKALGTDVHFNRSTGLCCAVGAIAPSTHDFGFVGIGLVFDDEIMKRWGVADEVSHIRAEFDRMGLTSEELTELQAVNDDFEGTPEQRYDFVTGWLIGKVQMEATS